jgi:valacyclovir hydrolase
VRQQTLSLCDGATLAYWDIGSGRPLLLMHGFTGTAQTHLGLLLENLSHHYRLIAPDLRGYGASQPPGRSFPPHFYRRDADDMATLLRHLDCGTAVVLGFSDGAESALLLAAAYPELVSGVIAWGVCGIISPAMLARVRPRVPLPDKAQWGDWYQQIALLHNEEQVEPMIRGWNEAAEAIYASGGNICLAEAAQIRCPVLLLNGDEEQGNPLPDAQRLAGRLKNGCLETIAGSGHPIHDDQPAVFLQRVREFLQTLEK